MDKILFQSYIINERSQIAFIKREIHNLNKPVFGESRTGEIDIVVAEMCSNVVKHAGEGEMLYRLRKPGGNAVFEVICIDNGPGMKDVSHSMKDGVSSKNTLGHGLGSISRLSSFSQVYSLPGWGTVIYACFQVHGIINTKHEKCVVRCINVAIPGETVSGDGIAIRHFNDKVMIFAGDGLGHGEFAHAAVNKAIATFNGSITIDPSVMIGELHQDVKKTRGLVATVAVADFDKKQWEICGVGNIMTRLQKGLDYKNYICNNGIVGLNIPGRLENALWELEKFQLLLFCSDGIKTRWDIVQYPSILKYDPIIIAAAIYKDQARKNDDMTILIAKIM